MTEEAIDVTALGTVSLLRGFQRGDVVFIQLSRAYPDTAMERMFATLKEFLKDTGVKFVILDQHMKVVGKPSEETT